MKKLITVIACLMLMATSFSQKPKQQRWVLSTSIGYINVLSPYSGSNVWSSVNIGYNVKKWSFVTWAGCNYWVKGKQPDFRVGISTNYTIKKW